MVPKVVWNAKIQNVFKLNRRVWFYLRRSKCSSAELVIAISPLDFPIQLTKNLPSHWKKSLLTNSKLLSKVRLTKKIASHFWPITRPNELYFQKSDWPKKLPFKIVNPCSASFWFLTPVSDRFRQIFKMFYPYLQTFLEWQLIENLANKS